MHIDTDDLVGSSILTNNLKGTKDKMRAASISSSNISLASESTSSKGLIGWSYQQTRDGKLYNMTQDNEWKELYNSRYINERVEAELVEFKEEIDKKFKISKSKNYKFPRKVSHKSNTRNDQSVSYANKSHYQSDDKNMVLLGKNFVFDYKNGTKENQKISRKNIDFLNNKKNNVKPPKNLSTMKTIDEENKSKLFCSMSKSGTSSKSRKNKHKRQATQFKFEQNENSCDRAK